jgi:tetratricopeptide (TPR) repeat protein
MHLLYYDDKTYISDNTHIRNGLDRASLAWSMTTLFQYWHPVTWISHALDCQLYGLNPAGHHVTNTIIHILNVVLLFLMLRSVTGAFWRSGFVAGLFAVHPLNVESVAWVAERKNLLCTLFFILAIWAYCWYVRRPGWRRYLAVLGLFALGIMAKPMIVTLPFVLLLVDYWPLGRYGSGRSRDGLVGDNSASPDCSGGVRPRLSRSIIRLAVEKVPMVILAAGACVITVIAQRKDGALGSTAGYPMSLRLENALVSYAKYLQQMVWPSGLSLIYPFPDHHLPTWEIGLAAAVLVLISVGAVVSAKRFRYFIVGWLWYVGTLVPMIGLVQVGFQARADRYAYVPLIGVFVAIVWGLAEWARSSPRAVPVLGALGLCVLVAMGITTNLQTRYWHDDISIMGHAVAVGDGNYIAISILATDLALSGKLDEALAEFSKITTADLVYDKAQNTIGMIYVQKGQLDEAIKHFKSAIEYNPQYSDPCNRLGAALMDEGHIEEAIPFFRRALEISPTHASAWANLGAAFEAKGEPAQAMEYYSQALQATVGRVDTMPEAVETAARINYRMGDLLARDGRTAEARDRYLEALRFSPGYGPAAKRLEQLRAPGSNR